MGYCLGRPSTVHLDVWVVWWLMSWNWESKSKVPVAVTYVQIHLGMNPTLLHPQLVSENHFPKISDNLRIFSGFKEPTKKKTNIYNLNKHPTELGIYKFWKISTLSCFTGYLLSKFISVDLYGFSKLVRHQCEILKPLKKKKKMKLKLKFL